MTPTVRRQHQSRLFIDSNHFKICIILCGISAITFGTYYFIGSHPLVATVVYLDTFRQEATVATENKEGIFEMQIPAVLEIGIEQQKLRPYLVAGFLFSLLAGGLSVAAHCGNMQSHSHEQRNVWKVVILSSIIVPNLVLHGASFIFAKRSTELSASDDLHKEIVDLLEFATDKHPSGLTAIEKALNCCRVVSKTNRTLSGAAQCNTKLITCTKAVIDIVNRSTVKFICFIVIVALTFAIYLFFLGCIVYTLVLLMQLRGYGQIQVESLIIEERNFGILDDKNACEKAVRDVLIAA